MNFKTKNRVTRPGKLVYNGFNFDLKVQTSLLLRGGFYGNLQQHIIDKMNQAIITAAKADKRPGELEDDLYRELFE